jgi:hypothetical protein
MTVLPSNMDAVLVAIPMVGMLFAGVFRLDELFGKPQKRAPRRRAIAGSDEDGAPICIDPDGKVVKRKAGGKTLRRAEAGVQGESKANEGPGSV